MEAEVGSQPKLNPPEGEHQRAAGEAQSEFILAATSESVSDLKS
jgi:hypothetical protein